MIGEQGVWKYTATEGLGGRRVYQMFLNFWEEKKSNLKIFNAGKISRMLENLKLCIISHFCKYVVKIAPI